MENQQKQTGQFQRDGKVKKQFVQHGKGIFEEQRKEHHRNTGQHKIKPSFLLESFCLKDSD
ncbi:MAG: hypothetical protein LBS03_00890 [Bacteroidales bacterium]|nr:hypothetical protein [Bacteroidales bacterium]